MTIAELIAELQRYPPHLPVIMDTTEMFYWLRVEKVEYSDSHFPDGPSIVLS